MTETQALTVRTMDDMTLGKVLVESRFFKDATQAAQAVVKVLAGREAGFGPIASMTGINVIQGKVSWSANLMAAAIKRSGRYNYRVREHTEKVCAIEFFEGKDSVGVSTFTHQDAVTASLHNSDNWKHYPKNMLFARAMSNGAKWYCPDVFGGVSVYTPEELAPGDYVDTDTGEIVDPEPPKPVRPPLEASAPAARPTNGAAKAPQSEGRGFYRCSHCGKGINGYTYQGKHVTAQEVAQKSLDLFKAQLCLDCAKGVKAGTIVLDAKPQPAEPEMEPLPPLADDDEADLLTATAEALGGEA